MAPETRVDGISDGATSVSDSRPTTGYTIAPSWNPADFPGQQAVPVLTVPPLNRPLNRSRPRLTAEATGELSVHNRVTVEPEDQPAVERLAQYIMRPPISLEKMRRA